MNSPLRAARLMALFWCPFTLFPVILSAVANLTLGGLRAVLSYSNIWVEFASCLLIAHGLKQKKVWAWMVGIAGAAYLIFVRRERFWWVIHNPKYFGFSDLHEPWLALFIILLLSPPVLRAIFPRRSHASQESH